MMQISSTPEKREDGMRRLYNKIENSMLEFQRKHWDLLKNENIYWWFAGKLGYKSKNYLYKIFRSDADDFTTDFGVKRIQKIIEITGDTSIATIAAEELSNLKK